MALTLSLLEFYPSHPMAGMYQINVSVSHHGFMLLLIIPSIPILELNQNLQVRLKCLELSKCQKELWYPT